MKATKRKRAKNIKIQNENTFKTIEERQRDQNMVLNLLRYHNRDKKR